MTLVNIDLRNAGYETGPDDRVVFYSPANRNEQGTIISTAEASVPLVDGQASKELAPGPVVVQILAQGVTDTRPKSGYVPEEGPVSLWDVVLDWTPALVDQGILAILATLGGARDEALGQVEGAVDNALGAYFEPPSTNLFDHTDVMDGWVLPKGSAVPAENSLHVLSYPIPVQGGQEYAFINMARLTWLADGEFVSSSEGGATGTARTTTSPAAATHLRLTVYKTLVETAQMNVGATLLPYEPGGTGNLKPDKLPTHLWFDLSPEEIGAQPAGDYLSGQVTPEDTTFFDASTNLVDLEGLVSGFIYPAGSGTMEANSSYSVTAPIPVTEGSQYTILSIQRITYFDDAGTYKGFRTGSANPPDLTTAPAGATYVRLTLRNTLLDSAQMNAGAELLPYEPGGTRLSPAYLPTMPDSDPLADRYILDAPGLSEVYTAPTVEAQPGLPSTTVEDVYGWYDQLVADHPTYVSRRDLGMSSDGVHPVYAYTLKPEEVPNTAGLIVSPDRVQPTPTALLMSGTHGYEEVGVYSLWRMAKALCEEWETSPVLDAMRWNFEVIIIPLVNPYGWGPETFGRHNANGVDMARNFSEGWRESEPGTSTYGGPAPLSEPEAQCIDALMGEVADRCVFGGSFHNFAGSAETKNMIWQAGVDQESMLLGKKLIARMSRKWRSKHDWITTPQTYFGYSDLGAPGGSEGRALVGHGILGSTFETAQFCYLDGVGGSKYDSRVMTLGYEAVVNYVAMGLAEGLRLK